MGGTCFTIWSPSHIDLVARCSSVSHFELWYSAVPPLPSWLAHVGYVWVLSGDTSKTLCANEPSQFLTYGVCGKDCGQTHRVSRNFTRRNSKAERTSRI